MEDFENVEKVEILTSMPLSATIIIMSLGNFHMNVQKRKRRQRLHKSKGRNAFDGLYRESTEKEAWFLNSGYSNHRCGKELFSKIDGIFRESLKLGDNSSLIVLGKGNVWIQVIGIVQVITRIFHTGFKR